MHRTCCSLLFFCLTFALFPQEEERFRVMFWNVENLFDCEHDSLKQDMEFLPASLRAWHTGRYKKKIADIARVITAVGEWEAPALVGLCEVENNRVMTDLTRYSPLKAYGYRYVMTDSPDERGIDVALLYQRDKFKLLKSACIRPYLGKGKRPTRDILHVTGLISSFDTLDVFVAHFPSRSGGEKETEPNRTRVAQMLRDAVDSLMCIRSEPRIIIMGDFNDYPDNRSVTHVLRAGIPASESDDHALYHLLARKVSEGRKSGYGSYKYRGEWGLLDHLIVSGRLLNASGQVYTNESKAHVARFPFLLTDDEKYGGVQPYRTYNGMKYQGGYSDHLPVYVDLLIK